MPSARHRTAMRRDRLSRPIRLALLHELLTPDDSLLDYGCGRGDDVSALRGAGFNAEGWDPHHRPDGVLSRSDVVNLGYVVNVIEDPVERVATLEKAWTLAARLLVVSARLEDERDEAHVAAMRDGWVTRRGTFQKFYSHEELGVWIEQSVGQPAVAAGLGVYYVFRSTADREEYLASRFRRPLSLPRSRPSDQQYQEHQDLLEPLMTFVGQRGRLPHESELVVANELTDAFGSLRKAFRVVLWVTDQTAWDRVRQERSVDLLVHVALARFHGRPRWSELPDPMQRDVRAFFSNYRNACSQADRLLFSTGNPDAINLACRASGVGKLTPAALYVHTSAMSEVPALLRIYEGCAKALVGTVEDATLIKLHRGEPVVSYLSYPDFDRQPHPALNTSVVCDLRERRVRIVDYRQRANPPILHRKELFVGNAYPYRKKFERLTAAEERHGLYEHPAEIGTLEGWEVECRRNGVSIRGHRVVRRPNDDDDLS